MRWLSDPVSPEVLSDSLDQTAGHMGSAAQYWAKLAPKLNDFGISRLANITGLDRLGFPVVQAVRPWARSNAVTQGKAPTLEGAAIGAVLECLEMAAGEDLERFAEARSGPLDLWRPLAPGLPDGVVWPQTDTRFIRAWNLSEDAPGAVPRDLVSTDFTQDAQATLAPILRHSIGLGAGPNLGMAMMHGLLECIEADARERAERFGGARRIAIDPEDETFINLLKTIDKNGLRAAIFALPSAAGVHVVQASVMEAPGATALPLPAVGYAARPCQSDAIAAALAEAVQARLAVISGAREDITQRFYAHGVARADLEAEWHRHAPALGTPMQTPSYTPNLRQLAQQVGPVFAVPLHWDPDLPLAITRIVAPQLIADPMRLNTP